MTPLDLTHLTEDIKKTKNWSIHRKRMYAMGLMHELYITDGSNNENEHSIIPASDRLLTAQLVSEVLDQLIEYDEISIFEEMVENHKTTSPSIQFSHILSFDDEAGIQYILNSNSWLKVLCGSNDIALVITGNLVGDFTFYLESSNETFEEKKITFNKNGIYRLSNKPIDRLYLAADSLKLVQ
ncbi:hypothetical protein [Lactococcus lactis]|uniref:hypothetical protein n=1 Tax=Lactococcus lactis TaxID=1358 RepID=UPI0023A96F86|nr:hypothetical protein [Lactococcus lactis]WEA54815.1 hypothetical protein PWP91_11085 [Lactococcus lactis]